MTSYRQQLHNDLRQWLAPRKAATISDILFTRGMLADALPSGWRITGESLDGWIVRNGQQTEQPTALFQ